MNKYLRHILSGLFVLSLVVMPMSAMAAAENFGIAATVNKDAISESDLDARMRLVFASAGMRDTKDNRAKARSQALNSLVEEQLKIQEAERQNIEITAEEVSQGFEAIAAQNNMSAEQFAEIMENQGISKSTLMNQIKSQIAWTKVVQRVLRPRIDVSENDVKAKMERIKANVGQVEYKASEIFLPVNAEADENQTKQLAGQLIEEIKNGKAPFAVVAQQFSKSASAQQGGTLGWVQEGQLPKELDVVMKSMAEGQISPPVRGLSGFHILMLEEKRPVSSENLPSEEDVLNSIGFERLDRLQQRYLADIRSAAFIDKR